MKISAHKLRLTLASVCWLVIGNVVAADHTDKMLRQ